MAIAFGGCLRGTLPAREMYRLALPDTSTRPALGLDGVKGLDGDVAIAPFHTPGLYGEDNIIFRIGDLEYGQYPSRLWALPLGEMLGLIAEASLSRRPITAGQVLYSPRDRDRFEYRWQATVREFEEVNRGDSVFAAVRFDLRLLRTADDSLLWTGSARRERYVARATMNAIVGELSRLADEVVAELADAIRGEFRRRASAPPEPTNSPEA